MSMWEGKQNLKKVCAEKLLLFTVYRVKPRFSQCKYSETQIYCPADSISALRTKDWPMSTTSNTQVVVNNCLFLFWAARACSTNLQLDI